jgi:hypothetical protein
MAENPGSRRPFHDKNTPFYTFKFILFITYTFKHTCTFKNTASLRSGSKTRSIPTHRFSQKLDRSGIPRETSTQFHITISQYLAMCRYAIKNITTSFYNTNSANTDTSIHLANQCVIATGAVIYYMYRAA